MTSTEMKVDYSQWQRTANNSKKVPTYGSQKAHGSRNLGGAVAAAAAQSGYRPFSVTSDQLSRVGSACSLSRCQHPWNNFRAMEAARNAREKKRARMKELNVKIQLQEKTLTDLRRRQAEIIRENISLFNQIESEEAQVANDANAALSQYQRSRDSISVMRLRFERQCRELEMEVADTKKKLDASISKLKKQVAKANRDVQEIYEELALLNNYKDKVYPERLVLIHQLKQKLASQKLNNEEEESELLQIIQAEHSKLTQGADMSLQMMKERVAQTALSELHPTLVSMSDENKQLAADVQFHANQNDRLRQEIQELQGWIADAGQHADCTIARSLFPQVFRERLVCCPDTELQFDIPERRLPII